MKSHRGLSIRARLLLAFIGVLVPYLALVAIGVVGFRTLSERLHSIEQEVTQDIEGATGLQVAILQMLMPANDYLTTGDLREREEFERRLAQTRGALARMESFSLQDPKARQLVEAIGGQVSQIETLGREILAVPDPRADHAAHGAAHAKMKALDRLGDEAAVILSQLREIEHREIREEVERGSGVVRRAAAAALAALVLSLAGGVALALLFSRWIGYPLQTIARASHAMAQGDLSQRVDTSSGGELAETARAFNLMVERLEASHAALRRTNDQEEARRWQAEALAAVGRDLVQSLDLAVVGERIVESVRQLLRVRFASLLRLEPESGDLVAVAVSENVAPIFGPGLVWPRGTGAVGLAVRERRLVVSEDVLADPRVTFTPEVRARIEQASFRAVIALPLVGKEGVIGALGIGDEVGRVFDAEEIRLAQAFADQATLALENAHLYEQSEARRRQAEALAVTARDLAQSLDPAEVFQRITDSIRRLLASPTTTLYRLEPESGDLRVVAASGAPALRAGTVFPRGGGAVGLAVELRGPVVSENALTDPRLTFTPEARARVEESRFWAVLAVPLVVKERVIGGLGIRDQEGRVFTAEEVRLAQAFADQAALSLENARLYEESEARHRVAEALAAIGRDLTQSLDVAVVGQRITDSIRQLLGLGYSRLYRLEPESGDLAAVAVSGGGEPAFRGKLVFPRGMGAVGLAVKERRPVISKNHLADPQIILTPELRDRMDSTFVAVLAVPLVAKDKVIGSLVVGDRVGRVYRAEEIRLVQAFADQAAIALENARLFQEAQHALADLKAAQEQLVQGATMRALGELASGTSHHLNNLMAIVLGRVRLLLAGPESAPLRRPLEVIERAAMDATEVVRRVSRFARMQPLEDWQPLDLRQLASEVLELTRARWQDAAQAQGIRIEAALEGPDLQPVMGNAAALREVLMNLVLNAVEALPNGGKIAVRTFSEGGWVGLAVSDTGVGMSPQVRERALEPFFTTKGPRSTGLGLSESYGILQRHGGKLTVESAEGQGTTVTVHLPVASPSVSEGTRGEPARLAASALRILVIDDDDEVREVVAEMLAAQGHGVLQASGGREGLALLEAGEKMDLVLTDLGMPGVTGWDVARAVRARWPGLPVGMLTGWGEQIDDATPDRRMVAGVLSKPATPEGLREFVAACHATSRRI